MLYNENPLVVNPELAKRFGLNEAIIIQQIHYWIEINRKKKSNFQNGKTWTYNSYEEWQQQFPFWSIPTIKRTILKLEKAGIILTGNYNKMKIDRTKWYTLNYEMLNIVPPSDQFDPTSVSDRSAPSDQIDPTNNQRLPEINAETTNKDGGKAAYSPEQVEIIKRFRERWKLETGHDPGLNKSSEKLLFATVNYYTKHGYDGINALCDAIGVMKHDRSTLEMGPGSMIISRLIDGSGKNKRHNNMVKFARKASHGMEREIPDIPQEELNRIGTL